MVNRVISFGNKQTSIAPLVTFRILFGLIMIISVIRFLVNGWVYDLYIKPDFFFTYYGFEWVRPLDPSGMYLLFGVMLVSAVGVMVGLYYRWSSALFFFSFTYVELIDKTNYLNHYYFVSLIAFLLIFLPAHRSFSVDVWRRRELPLMHVPAWVTGILKFQLAVVYIFAGLAKLNSDWLIHAMPLKIWLPANSHIPVVGGLFAESWVAYGFSWLGAAYDLFIVFFLLSARTRRWAYGAVLGFHLITWWLFPIGMFPFIMIACTLIFFSDKFHQGIINVLRKLTDVIQFQHAPEAQQNQYRTNRVIPYVVTAFVVVQLMMPLRHVFYPGDLFWTEQGYRFSWRVMLMEKAGYVIFHITDPDTGRTGDVMGGDYLTPVQEKMMSTQPDMILQFAHFLEKEYKKKGIREPRITADAYVTLNGCGSRRFIDPSVDLTDEHDDFRAKDWIVSFEP